jgi:hypothetical protein
VDTVPVTTGDVRTVLIITGAVVPRHWEDTTATEVLLEAVVVVALLPLPPPVETAMDRRHTVEAVVAPLLLMTAIVVVVMAPILLLEVHMVEPQIPTVATVDLLPNPRARAAATPLQEDLLPVVEMTPVDPLPILPR